MNASVQQEGQASLQMVRLVECPRDAMQGWKHQIPTEQKIAYINKLLQVGFDTIDFGSFVSPKAIPQMADTRAVLNGLSLKGSRSKLLAIVANERGAEEAAAYPEIDFLGYPFSVSETFQQRNTNAGINRSLSVVATIQDRCLQMNKQLVVYISMAFGNPYGDAWSEDIVYQWVDKLTGLDIRIISLADTVGLASPEQISSIAGYLVKSLPDIEIGVHLHARPGEWKEKVQAALQAGCQRFDSALKGYGGCPMAGDDLVGNIDTEKLLPYFSALNILPEINQEALQESSALASGIFI